MRRLRKIALALMLVAAGCAPRGSTGPVVVSVIGTPEWTDRGLVRLDGAGQVVPGRALRWAILDHGLDYLFRLDDRPGLPSAEKVARRLRAALTNGAARPAALPAVVESLTAVTPTVVELRLAFPEPDLLVFLAQVPLDEGAKGEARAGTSEQDGPSPIIHRDRAGVAVARFRANAAALVVGGRFADLPVAQVAGLDPAALRFDPATGLFGFAPVAGSAYADARVLRALSLALDRERIVADLGAPGLVAADPTPAANGPNASEAERLAEAQALIAQLPAPLPPLRVALPAGPGATLLAAHLVHDWRRLGLIVTPVASRAAADLVLVDRVAPKKSVMALACAVSAGCDLRDAAARAAPPFLFVTTPIRWWLGAQLPTGFTPNPLAAHPLGGIRGAR